MPALRRRYHELHVLAQDPVLLAGLLVVGAFTRVWGVWASICSPAPRYRPSPYPWQHGAVGSEVCSHPLPAFIAGLIFSFARHITSLSAIIFLTNPRWRILTALILSEVEQGGMSVAAAYSVLLIVLVFGAIGIMSVVAGRAFRTAEGVDMALGAR